MSSQPIQIPEQPTDLRTRGLELGAAGVGDLETANVLEAIALGIVGGEACIRQVLMGSPGPLGERQRDIDGAGR